MQLRGAIPHVLFSVQAAGPPPAKCPLTMEKMARDHTDGQVDVQIILWDVNVGTLIATDQNAVKIQCAAAFFLSQGKGD